MSEDYRAIIAKTEDMVRTVVEMGHLCSLRRWHDALFAAMVFQCDAARWLPDQDRYGHTFHVRQAVSDAQMANARDPHFLMADAAYRVVRDVLSELGLWKSVEARWREAQHA